jgi:hypothetical protein
MFSVNFKDIPPYLHMLQHVFRSFQEYPALPTHAPACFQVISRISRLTSTCSSMFSGNFKDIPPYLHMLQHVFRSFQGHSTLPPHAPACFQVISRTFHLTSTCSSMSSGNFKDIPPYLHMLQHVFMSFQGYPALPQQ